MLSVSSAGFRSAAKVPLARGPTATSSPLRCSAQHGGGSVQGGASAKALERMWRCEGSGSSPPCAAWEMRQREVVGNAVFGCELSG